jgi:hypothetical protein
MIVRNNSKAVIVLKARGHKPLRLLPGFNETGTLNIDAYFKGNKAAQAHAKKYLTNHSKKDLDTGELEAAEKAKEKNDKMNIGYKVPHIQQPDSPTEE